MSAEIRKLLVLVEETRREMGRAVEPPTRKAQPSSILMNPKSGARLVLPKLGLELRMVRGATRMMWPTAYDAGETAGASLTINPGIRGHRASLNCQPHNTNRKRP